MKEKGKAVLDKGNRTRRWSLALLVAVTVVASVAMSSSVGGKQNPDPALSGAGGTGGANSVQAVDAFIWFEMGDGTKTNAFEIKDFSFGVENPTTIGSATGGAGAGKIKFNEFTIKKTSDSASPAFFKTCATGSHYKTVTLQMRKAGGDAQNAGKPYMAFKFGTVFTTKIDWSGPGDEGPEESITFVYGTLHVSYFQQDKKTGTLTEITEGWDQVSNTDEPPVG